MTLTERLNGKRPLALCGAAHTDDVMIDETWSLSLPGNEAVLRAGERLKRFLRESFSLSLDGTEHLFIAELAPGLSHGFSLSVSTDAVRLRASEYGALVKGLSEIEARMRARGAAVLKTGDETVSPRLWPRLAFLGTDEVRADDLLYAGYDGVAVTCDASFPFEAQKDGLLVFLAADRAVEPQGAFDGVIWQGEVTDEALSFSSRFAVPAFDTLFWESEPALREQTFARLPKNATVISSFEAGACLTRGEIACTAPDGLLAVTEASERFTLDRTLAQKVGLTLWTRVLTAGKIPYLADMVPLPAMMQHVLRTDGLLSCGAVGTLETNGFVPSLVADYYREALRTPCDEPGVLTQKLAMREFGAAQVEAAALGFKKLSDAFSALTPLAQDLTPLAYGAAFPLTEDEPYELPAFDITLCTEQILTAADHFRKAQAIFSRMTGEEACETAAACGLCVNALVTLANVQRTARRQKAIAAADQAFKAQFLREQIAKIGREEMQNAEETMEILAAHPALYLPGSLCTPEFLEDKLVLTARLTAKME